jgi:predicted transposase YbfD/YdcC
MRTTVPSLREALAELPDFRQPQGRRYELLPILLLVCVAMLCGYSSQSAIAQWGNNYGAHWLERLGFAGKRAPSQSTLHRIFNGIDHLRLENILARWAEAWLSALTGETRLHALALDGKSLCASQKSGSPTAHLLAGLSHQLALVMAQINVNDKSNEISKADELLAMLVLQGKVITADAMLTQRAISQQIRAGGGHYLLVVKKNQPSLLDDCQMAFCDLPSLADRPAEAALSSQAHTNTEHGGRVEERHLKVSSILDGQSDWPGLRQVLKLERKVTHKRRGRGWQETAYAITSLGAEEATAAELLGLWRGHWSIENKLHWVRDVQYREDKMAVRKGQVPQVMAAFRNAALSVLRLQGEKNIAAACRRFAAQPELALQAVGVLT